MELKKSLIELKPNIYSIDNYDLTEGCLHISENFEIHGGYLGIISFGICVIIIILYLLFVGAVDAMMGNTIKEVNDK